MKSQSRPPSWPYCINRDSPQAQGLVCWLTPGMAAEGVMIDLGPYGGHGRFTNSPTWKGMSGEGAAVDFTSTAHLLCDNVVPDSEFLGELSIVYRGVVRTGSAFRDFCSKHDTNGATKAPFSFRTTNDATPLLANVRANNTDFYIWNGPAVTLGVPKTYAVSCPAGINSTAVFYIDGVPTNGTAGGGSSGSGAPTGNAIAIRIGRRQDGAVQADGQVSDLRIYKRMLSAHEQWQAWSPGTRYQLYYPLGRKTWFL